MNRLPFGNFRPLLASSLLTIDADLNPPAEPHRLHHTINGDRVSGLPHIHDVVLLRDHVLQSPANRTYPEIELTGIYSAFCGAYVG